MQAEGPPAKAVGGVGWGVGCFKCGRAYRAF